MIVRAGGLHFQNGQRLDLRPFERANRAHAAWLRHGRGPEPERSLSPVVLAPGDARSGRYAGGVILPRHAPGLAPGADRTVLVEAAPARAPGLRLRPYQSRALAAWHRHEREGVVVAPCGAGKTMIGVAAIASTDTRALVLVHTLDLARQWVERLDLLEGVSVGLVGGGKVDKGTRVVVATMQTVSTWPWWERYDWLRDFGLVVVDEAHHTPCSTLLGILSSAPGAYRLGLTATPRRQDGLEDWLTWAIGPTVDSITPAELEALGATLRPQIRRVHTGWSPTPFDGWHELGDQLTAAEDRNEVIAQQATALIGQGRQVLVLTERVEHARVLAEQIGTARALVGDTAQGERVRTLADLRAGDLRCVVATQLADEGLDVPTLSAVVLAWPSRHVGAVQQRIGRACRPGGDQGAPVVVDLRDDYGVLRGYARARDRLYADLGW